MKISRRDFCQTLAAAATYGMVRPAFTFAQAGPAAKYKNLVHLFLYGGCDSKQIYPFFSGGPIETELRKPELRGSVYVPNSNILRLNGLKQTGRNDQFGFHPSYGSLIADLNNPALFAQNIGAALISEIGVTQNYSFSHEEAQLQFLTARSNVTIANQGHVGRLIDAAHLPAYAVWGVGENHDILFKSDTQSPIITGSLGEFNYANRWYDQFSCTTCTTTNTTLRTDFDDQLIRDTGKKLLAIQNQEFDSPLKATLESSLNNAPSAVAFNQGVMGVNLNTAYFPTNGAQSITYMLGDIARAINYTNSGAAPSELRNSFKIFCSSLGGWDHHVGLSWNAANMASKLNESLRALIRQLKDWGMFDSTVIMVWSEFGRTIRVNGSSGTDHGHSQDCLILGGKIKREVFGPEPTLAETINKNVYTPQVSFTSLLKHLYQSGGIPDDVVNQVLSESFPGSQEFNLFV